MKKTIMITNKIALKVPKKVFQFALCSAILMILPHWNHVLATTKKMLKPEKAPFIISDDESDHNSTIIFLHDYTEDGEFWEHEMLDIRQPFMKVVCPTANHMVVSWKSKPNVSSWCNFEGENMPRISNDTDEQIEESTNYVHHLIEEEIKNGIKPERIIVGGIQQGAVLALHSALSFPKKLGAIIFMSPWPILNKTFDEAFNPVQRDIPIIHAHVDGNLFTTKKTQIEAFDKIKKISKNAVYKEFPGIGKLATSKLEIDFIRDFIHEKFSP